MAILRPDEIRTMSQEEIEEKLDDLHGELMKVNGVLASGGVPEDIGRVKEIKKTIARIKTIQNESG